MHDRSGETAARRMREMSSEMPRPDIDHRGNVGTRSACSDHSAAALSSVPMRWRAVLPILLLWGCGGSPSAPTPVPVPVPAPIIQPDPAQFDATFNAQLVHDSLDNPTATKRSGLLLSSPSIYVQTTGMSAATVAAMEAEARQVVPLLSGGKLSVGLFETGSVVRPPVVGWIVVEEESDAASGLCGRSLVGAQAGHIYLNMGLPGGCNRPLEHVLGHELGHALGFYHVADPSCLMSITRPIAHNGAPCDKERYHAGLAYQSNGAYSSSYRDGRRQRCRDASVLRCGTHLRQCHLSLRSIAFLKTSRPASPDTHLAPFPAVRLSRARADIWGITASQASPRSRSAATDARAAHPLPFSPGRRPSR